MSLGGGIGRLGFGRFSRLSAFLLRGGWRLGDHGGQAFFLGGFVTGDRICDEGGLGSFAGPSQLLFQECVEHSVQLGLATTHHAQQKQGGGGRADDPDY